MFRTCDPRGGASFDPKGHHMNNLGIGPLTKFQSSMPSFKVLCPLVAMATRVMIGIQSLEQLW